MIFVTVGTQKFQMNRLLKAIDDYVQSGEIMQPVFMQTGHSTYIPKHCEYSAFLTAEEMKQKINDADLVITHGGTASIIESIKAGKKIIAVIRKPEYGEHVDAHQAEIVNEFEQDGLLLGTDTVRDIPELINKANATTFSVYQGNKENLLEDIRKVLAGWKNA